MENLLKNEKSPYLKQHKDNPVNWLAWSKKLEKAKEKKTNILKRWFKHTTVTGPSVLKIIVAKIMNAKFINIKVDREERPDLDFLFQKV